MFISIQTLNAIKQQWIINGDIIYPPKTWCDYPPPPRHSEFSPQI